MRYEATIMVKLSHNEGHVVPVFFETELKTDDEIKSIALCTFQNNSLLQADLIEKGYSGLAYVAYFKEYVGPFDK